jgi:signal transduction histidine kinase
MGLGLAITQRIIENFKGEIWFQTEMNVGTTFYIKVPLAG